MNTLRKVAALVGLLSLASLSHAAQPWAIGAVQSAYEIGSSTPALTAMLVSAGPGTLSTAQLSSTTAGGYCAFFDSATAAGITTANQDGTLVAPKIGTVWFATANIPAYLSPAVPFRNGLVAICQLVSRLILFGERN